MDENSARSWWLAHLYVLCKGGNDKVHSSQLFLASLSSFHVHHPRRYYGTSDLHFINYSCYHRQPWLGTPQRRDLFLIVLEQVRQRYRFVVVGYVVMPGYIHLLISEPEQGNPSRLMQAIKQGFARQVLKSLRRRRVAAHAEFLTAAAEHVWQKRLLRFQCFHGS